MRIVFLWIGGWGASPFFMDGRAGMMFRLFCGWIGGAGALSFLWIGGAWGLAFFYSYS